MAGVELRVARRRLDLIATPQDAVGADGVQERRVEGAEDVVQRHSIGMSRKSAVKNKMIFNRTFLFYYANVCLESKLTYNSHNFFT